MRDAIFKMIGHGTTRRRENFGTRKVRRFVKKLVFFSVKRHVKVQNDKMAFLTREKQRRFWKEVRTLRRFLTEWCILDLLKPHFKLVLVYPAFLQIRVSELVLQPVVFFQFSETWLQAHYVVHVQRRPSQRQTCTASTSVLSKSTHARYHDNHVMCSCSYSAKQLRRPKICIRTEFTSSCCISLRPDRVLIRTSSSKTYCFRMKTRTWNCPMLPRSLTSCSPGGVVVSLLGIAPMYECVMK